MPYNIEWLVKERVVRVHVHGNLSLEEAHNAYEELEALTRPYERELHLILEHTGLKKFPLNLNVYNFIITGRPLNRGGWMLIVGTDRQARFIARLLSHASGLNSATFDTLEQALSFLAEQDSTLAAHE